MNEKTKRLCSMMCGRQIDRWSDMTGIEIEACLNSWASSWQEAKGPDRGYDRTPALAAVRTIRSNAERSLKYLSRPASSMNADPERGEIVAFLEMIVRISEPWKKKTLRTGQRIK